VGVVRMNLGEAEKYSRIADATQKLTSLAIKEMGKESERQGEKMAQAVVSSKITSINPKTGKPEALDWVGESRFMGRVGAEAYTRVINDRFQQEIENEIKEKAGELALKFENDPYSPEKYEQQMNNYLQEMASASEENGQPTLYTNFIMSQGAQYVTATKLNMMQERNRREREKLGISIGLKNTENVEAAYLMGQSGQVDKFAPFLEGSVNRNKDGENANITKRGTHSVHENAMQTAFVQGRLDVIFEGKSRTTRLKIIDAIRRKTTDGLSSEVKAAIDELLPYVTAQNKGTLTSYGSNINGTLTSIELIAEANEKERLANNKKFLLNTFLSDADGLESTSYNSILDAYNNASDLDPTKRDIALQTAINAAIDDASQLLNETKIAGTDLTPDARRAINEDIRRSVLTPLMIAAASDGNVNDLALYVTTKNPRAAENLTEFQLSVANGLRNGKIPFDADDVTYIRQLLGDSEDTVKTAIDNYKDKSNFDNGITDLINDIMTGEDDAGEWQSSFDSIDESILHSAAEKDSLKLRMQTARTIQGINSLSNLSSQDLNNISTYIQTGGQDNRGLSSTEKETIDSVLPFINDLNRTRVVQELSRREADERSREIQEAEERRIAAEQYKLAEEARYGGVTKTKKHREAIDKQLAAKEIDILSPSSETDEFYQMMSVTMSENLYQALKTLGSDEGSFSQEQANVLMNHYARLRNRLTADGVVDGLYGLELNKGLLDDALSIRNLATGTTIPISGIIRDLKKRAAEGDLEVLSEFKVKGSGRNVVHDYLSTKYNNDKMIIKELSPIVEYYAKTGRTINDINSLTDDIVETLYFDSKYIVDPSMPLGSFSKSRFALAYVFPQEEERTEFIKLVNQNLPEGYTLASTTSEKTEQAEGVERLVREAVDPTVEGREVYLMPYGVTNAPQYYAYYKEPQTGELRPLIYERTVYDPRTMNQRVELTWPMFDMDLTADFRRQSEADRIAKEQNAVENRQAQFGPLNEPAKESAYGRALSRGILGGL
jgi:hypothetical protein